MKSMEEWNRCLDLLLSGALQDLHTTQEYEYRKNRREYIDKMLDADLTRDQKTTVDEVLLELESDAERQTQQMYRQGFRDCVLMLKNLGVLA